MKVVLALWFATAICCGYIVGAAYQKSGVVKFEQKPTPKYLTRLVQAARSIH